MCSPFRLWLLMYATNTTRNFLNLSAKNCGLTKFFFLFSYTFFLFSYIFKFYVAYIIMHRKLFLCIEFQKDLKRQFFIIFLKAKQTVLNCSSEKVFVQKNSFTYILQYLRWVDTNGGSATWTRRSSFPAVWAYSIYPETIKLVMTYNQYVARIITSLLFVKLCTSKHVLKKWD